MIKQFVKQLRSTGYEVEKKGYYFTVWGGEYRTVQATFTDKDDSITDLVASISIHELAEGFVNQ